MADRLRPSGPADDVDHDTLAAFLRALAYPARLQLLEELKVPHSVGDIVLRPRRSLPGENPERPVARQTVRQHLEKLVEAGLVRVDGSGERRQYVVNPAKLYAMSESLRRLTVQYAGWGAIGDFTGSSPLPEDVPEVSGPRLVLVHGVHEGKAYPLVADTQEDGQWLIGRRRDAAVPLDYDPYVSAENSAISLQGSAFVLTDLPTSKNGTWVNWRPMPREGSRTLRAGDLIGVGRSLLAFAPA